jgi:thymidine phosphorylase
MSFSTPSLICSKRDGGTLSDAQITWLLEAYLRDEVADEQMSALLMAIVFRGLDDRELATWTRSMIESGIRLDLSALTRPTVDKHSTGCVGDKISLILAPLVAACGAAVPQLSGRGLGHTGGTLDKLEAIPGWRATLSLDEVVAQLENVGAVICAASADLAPADRRLYALRDVTGTVESIPLICASIMSKKIAEGTDGLVLDVKVGRGAFMKDLEQARLLARRMIDVGVLHGVRASALLTRMDAPLGVAVGNALEVTESVDVLQGGGPADIRALTLDLAREMVSLAGLDVDVERVLDSGVAYETYCAMIRAQGGDPEAVLAPARFVATVESRRSGVVSSVDALGVGLAACATGAGRVRKEDDVVASAGIRVLVRPGDEVGVGEALFEVHAETTRQLEAGIVGLNGVVGFDGELEAGALVIERVV